MPDQMTKSERVLATIQGKEVDRPAISMWRHFYKEEQSTESLAQALLAFQNRFDWDFAKVNPRANFLVEDWGVKSTYSSNPFKAPDTIDWPVKKAADWDKIQPLDVRKGVLGQHLELLKLIAKGLKGQTPFVMTLFTPLGIAGRLAGTVRGMLKFMQEHPKKVHQVMEIVTDPYTQFAKECLGMGAWGLFYATTHWGTYNRLTDAQYNEFGRKYDLKLLKALPKAQFHIMHVCSSLNMLKALADYPVHAFNWDTQDLSNVWLKEGRQITGKAVIGGVAHKTTLAKGTPRAVSEEVARARKELGNKGWMAGPGCTFPPEAPEANLMAARKAVEG